MCLPALIPVVVGIAQGVGAAAAAVAPIVSAAIPYVAAVGALGSAIATPIVTVRTQQMAADAQSKYQQQVYDINKDIADQSLMSQYADISRRQQEEQKKAAQEMSIISSQAMQARSTAQASAIEAGAAGLSINNIVDDYVRRESAFLSDTQTQLRGTLFQLERSKEGLRSEYQGRVLSATPQPVSSPSGLSMALGIAGNLSDVYASTYFNKADTRTRRAGY